MSKAKMQEVRFLASVRSFVRILDGVWHCWQCAEEAQPDGVTFECWWPSTISWIYWGRPKSSWGDVRRRCKRPESRAVRIRLRTTWDQWASSDRQRCASVDLRCRPKTHIYREYM